MLQSTEKTDSNIASSVLLREMISSCPTIETECFG